MNQNDVKTFPIYSLVSKKVGNRTSDVSFLAWEEDVGENGLKFSLSTFSHFKNYIWNRNSEMGNLRDFYKKREAHWPQSIFIWRHNSKMISSERWPLNLTGFGHVTKTSRKKPCRVSRVTGSIRAQGVFSDIKTWASLSKGISFQLTV